MVELHRHMFMSCENISVVAELRFPQCKTTISRDVTRDLTQQHWNTYLPVLEYINVFVLTCPCPACTRIRIRRHRLASTPTQTHRFDPASWQAQIYHLVKLSHYPSNPRDGLREDSPDGPEYDSAIAWRLHFTKLGCRLPTYVLT